MAWNWIEHNILDKCMNFLLYTLQPEFIFRNNLILKITSDEAQVVGTATCSLPFFHKKNKSANS